jgi:hypothetical protein
MIVRTGSEESRLPDFLIVGAARSAKTSLFYYLKNYGEIYMPSRKEPWFFSYADNPPPTIQARGLATSSPDSRTTRPSSRPPAPTR